MKGSGPLYDELHELLSARAVPTSIHRLARLARARPARAGSGAPAARDDGLRPRARAGVSGRGRGVRRRLLPRVRSGRREVLPLRARRDRPRRRRPEPLRDGARPSPADGDPEAARQRRSRTGAGLGELRRHRGRLPGLPARERPARPRSRWLWRRTCAGATSSSSATRCRTGTCGSCSTGSGAAPRSAIAPGRSPRGCRSLERALWRRRDVDVLNVGLEDFVDSLVRRAGTEVEAARDRRAAASVEPVQGARGLRGQRARCASLLRARARHGHDRGESDGVPVHRPLRPAGRREELRPPGRRRSQASLGGRRCRGRRQRLLGGRPVAGARGRGGRATRCRAAARRRASRGRARDHDEPLSGRRLPRLRPVRGALRLSEGRRDSQPLSRKSSVRRTCA